MNAQPVNSTLLHQHNYSPLCPPSKKGLSGARDENISWPLFLRMKVAVQYPKHHNGLLATKKLEFVTEMRAFLGECNPAKASCCIPHALGYIFSQCQVHIVGLIRSDPDVECQFVEFLSEYCWE